MTGSGPVELPADVAQPAVTDEEADQVVADFAKPAIAAPVKVKVANAGSFEVSPRMLASSIEFLSSERNSGSRARRKETAAQRPARDQEG